MAYVVTENQMSMCRSERDFKGFEDHHRRKIEAHFDYEEAPKVFTEKRERGRRFTVVTHAVTKMVLGVIENGVRQ